MLLYEKYHHLGNDFILIDDRKKQFVPTSSFIQKICHRYIGIGADGCILLQEGENSSIKMRIFNADGSEAASCGNGLICLGAFARSLGYEGMLDIETGAGMVQITSNSEQMIVHMQDPKIIHPALELEVGNKKIMCSWINTGVDHAVIVNDVLPDKNTIETLGKNIRYHPHFAPQGTNVDFACLESDAIRVHTYEKGVEAMTKACGTGAIAVAVTYALRCHTKSPIKIAFSYGTAVVDFQNEKDRFFAIRYMGRPHKICSGHYFFS